MSTVTVIAYMLILSRLTGVCAHGMLVYAQRTIQIGTIGIGQIVQPALAVIWSHVLLGEVLRGAQAVGITLVMAGLFGFLVLNERRTPGPSDAAPGSAWDPESGNAWDRAPLAG